MSASVAPADSITIDSGLTPASIGGEEEVADACGVVGSRA